MGLIANPTLSLIEHVMRFRNERHDVIASNIANSNTPGYRAFDLVLDGALDAGGSIGLSHSNPRHIADAGVGGTSIGSALPTRDPARLDGNNVSLDNEFLKLTENRLMYQTAFELYENFGALTRVAREVR
jgi:flagellar basal-body rod protein FlgB